MDNVFSKIVKGEIPKEFLYEDEGILAFYDIHPVAPVHIILIPKKEIVSLATLKEEEKALMGKILWVAHQLAEKEGIAERGYRVVTNSGSDGGQEVPHIHFHLIGGKRLGSKIG